jgi:hypothetical protein
MKNSQREKNADIYRHEIVEKATVSLDTDHKRGKLISEKNEKKKKK